MPNNAIVGGSGDIAVGAALYKRINRKPGIVIANIGDASMGCGPVWEGMMLAAMDQYRTLWPEEIGGAPPMLFNFMNNFYGMGGQPVGETMGFGVLARVGLGVNPEAMHAERVDGYNPLAVADAIERKQQILAEGRGPVLLDTITYRFSGHSPSDAMAYRTKEELDLWREQDSIIGYGEYLIANDQADERPTGDGLGRDRGAAAQGDDRGHLARSLALHEHRLRRYRRPDVLQHAPGSHGRPRAGGADPGRGEPPERDARQESASAWTRPASRCPACAA